jgi:hypothetical protein
LLDKPTAAAKLLRQYRCCTLLNTVEDVTVLEVADMHVLLGHRYSEIMECCLYWVHLPAAFQTNIF